MARLLPHIVGSRRVVRFPLAMVLLIAAVLLLTGSGRAAEKPGGHLLIVGGGLRPTNAAIYQRLVEHAGGKGRARFGVFRTASSSDVPAKRVMQTLEQYG